VIGYWDCPTGISGDMCLGALVDAGVPLELLQGQLQGLGLSDEFELRSKRVTRNGQVATRVEVNLNHQGPHRHLKDIEGLIQQAQLPPQVQDWSLAIFRRLAEAEGAVHGIAPEEVHFHEVGATDAIVDIVGTCLGLDWLGIDALYCSALPTGGGRVRAAHGWLPVPAPAVLRLLQRAQVPIYSNGIEAELVTPTGCAIATTLAQGFGPPPPLQLQRLGLGAGGRDLPLPNLLRLWLGQTIPGPAQPSTTASAPLAAAQPASPSPHLETIAVLQTQVDDLNPQAIGYLFERLLQVGALDVFTQAIAMKKNRPGVLITVIALIATIRVLGFDSLEDYEVNPPYFGCFTGRVANLVNQEYRIMEDMIQPSKLTTVRADEIEAMRPATVSMMPAGLVDSLTREEILDLLAFLQSTADQE